MNPGAEMQHDTSPYQVELAGRRARLIASLLYLRYSKRRYLQVLPRLRPLPDEVLLPRGADVLGLRRPAVHHRQHQPGPVAGHRAPTR